MELTWEWQADVVKIRRVSHKKIICEFFPLAPEPLFLSINLTSGLIHLLQTTATSRYCHRQSLSNRKAYAECGHSYRLEIKQVTAKKQGLSKTKIEILSKANQ